MDVRALLADLISLFRNPCSHPKVFNGVCLSCAQTSEVARLKKLNSETMFQQKKLHLVLDLDHTLLHAINFNMLACEDEHLMKLATCSNESSPKSDDDLFKIATGPGLLVKLRPYIKNFLKEASTMYEIYICTMGTRSYAEKIAELIDPKGEYNISSRLITREDFKEKGLKDLDLVLGQEHSVVIVDDTEEVWKKNHKENLILVGRYNYFKDGRRKNQESSYNSERRTDENELNGTLVNVLGVLKRVHGLFFENPKNILVCGDVRRILGNIRRQILAGCILFFNDDVAEFPLLRLRAEELGAACAEADDVSVTHVVSAKLGTEDCTKAEQQKKFLVHPAWIYAAYYLWRQDEN